MKIIKRSKKAYLTIGLICLVSSILGLTYSAFTVNIENKRASEMYIGNLIYGINIVNEDNTTEGIVGRNVTLGAGESKIIKVTLTSLNPVASKYKLQYKVNSGTSVIKYMSTTPSPVKGDIEKETSTNTLEMLIYVENTGSTSSEISFGASGGYTHNNLNQIALIPGYTEIIDEYFINLHNDLQLALTVDGATVTQLNPDYFYELTSYTCQNGSNIEWIVKSSEIRISKYQKQESCTLNFTTSSQFILLRHMDIGSYVEYTATNGCATNCTALWRLAYLEGNRPVITSANNVQAVGSNIAGGYAIATNLNALLTPIAMKYCNLEFTGSCANYGVAGNTTRPFESTDFTKIMLQAYGTTTNVGSCADSSLAACGYGQDMLVSNASYIYGSYASWYESEGTIPKIITGTVMTSSNGAPKLTLLNP